MIFPKELTGDFFPLAKSKSNKRVFRSPHKLINLKGILIMPLSEKRDLDDLEQELKQADSWDTLYSHVSNNTPYNGVVLGVGRIKYQTAYIPLTNNSFTHNKYIAVADKTRVDQSFINRTRVPSHPVADTYRFVEMTVNGVGVLTEIFTQSNKWYTNTNPTSGWGTRVDIKFPSMNKVIPIVSTVGKVSGIISATFLYNDFHQNGMTIDSNTNLIFFAISFIPGVGWVISGIYFIVDTFSVLTTGQSAAQRVNNFLFDKWISFNRELESRIKSIFMLSYF